ncbi:MAG: FAD-binding oxidoreductase [Acidobacteriota bacterium]
MPSVPSFLPSCDPVILRSSALREGTPLDAIDGVQPGHVAEPASPQALAELLAGAARDGASVVLRGGGTKLGWGRQPKPVDLVISTRRLNRVLTHAYGDLTATVEAGTPIRALNQELRRHGQWLPIDAPFDEATVGGVIATNDSGPLRHRHGTPRDLLIGVHLAMTDGRVVKAGGTVVKNVAGYDLGKLVSGSHGSLAAIVDATFKLAPLPGASTTVVAAFHEPGALVRAVSAVSASQLEPTAFDLHVVAALGKILIQFSSTPAAIDAQVEELRRWLVTADSFELVTGPAEADVWRGQTRGMWESPGSIVRASWLPANLPAVLSLLTEMAGEQPIQLAARAGVGAGLIRIEGNSSAHAAAIEGLRARPGVVGHVVVLRAEAAVKQQIDVWGGPSDHEALLGAVKRAFDPAGILNAGRGPV